MGRGQGLKKPSRLSERCTSDPKRLLDQRNHVKTHIKMMAEYHIRTEIVIDAPLERVWAILTNFAEMPSWNPFITSISGNLDRGAQLTIFVVPPGKSGMQFRPTILRIDVGRELRRLGHLFIRGLLVGLLSGMFAATEDGFRAMNQALKQQSEKSPALSRASCCYGRNVVGAYVSCAASRANATPCPARRRRTPPLLITTHPLVRDDHAIA